MLCKGILIGKKKSQINSEDVFGGRVVPWCCHITCSFTVTKNSAARFSFPECSEFFKKMLSGRISQNHGLCLKLDTQEMCMHLHFQAPAMPLEGTRSNSQRVCAASPGECRGLLSKSLFVQFLKWCFSRSYTTAASSRAVLCVT